MLLAFALVSFFSFLATAVVADSYRRSYYAERRARAADDVEAAEECAEHAAHREDAVRALHAARAEVADLANELALTKHDVVCLEVTIDEMAMQAYDAAQAIPTPVKAKNPSHAPRGKKAKSK